MTKYPIKQLKERFALAHGERAESIMAGEGTAAGCEAAGHMASVVRKRREEKRCYVQLGFSFQFGLSETGDGATHIPGGPSYSS